MNLVRVVLLCASAALLCLGALFYFSVYDHEEALLLRERTYDSYDPLEHCVTPFGTILGYANGVPAFSNCLTSYKTTYVNYVNMMDPQDVGRRPDPSETTVVMLGMRYTSIDFYMRWLAWNRGLMPRLVDDTSQFWKANSFFNPGKPEQDWDAEFISNYAEASDIEEIKFNCPRKADAVLYGQVPDVLPDGLISVIVKVEDDVEAAGGPEKLRELKKSRLHPRRLYVAEQNYKNENWGGKNYTRILKFQWRRMKTGSAYEGFIEDPDDLHIIGTVRIGRPKPLRTTPDAYEEMLNHDGDGDL